MWGSESAKVLTHAWFKNVKLRRRYRSERTGTEGTNRGVVGAGCDGATHCGNGVLLDTAPAHIRAAHNVTIRHKIDHHDLAMEV